MKKIHTFCVEDKVYRDFKMYSIMVNRSVSSLLEEYMRNVLKKMNKKEK